MPTCGEARQIVKLIRVAFGLNLIELALCRNCEGASKNLCMWCAGEKGKMARRLAIVASKKEANDDNL